MIRILVALIVSIAAASCAAVRTNVTVTHTLPPAAAAKTVAIVPYIESLASAPDFQDYARRLSTHLQAKGYTVVPPAGGAAPDYVAFFMYGVDGGTPVNQLEGRAHPNTGSIITYGLRTTFSPATRRVYKRMVILDIVDRTRYRPNELASVVDARVYSASVTSDGPCSTMAPVIDPMLLALFEDFPGQSGAVRTITVPADTACGPNRFG